MRTRATLNWMLRARQTLRPFARDTTGAVAVMAALVFPVLVGGMALGAEAGFWYLSQRKLQQAADFAAHAGAVQLRSGGTNVEMVAAANAMAVASSFVAGEDTLVLTNPPTTGSRAGHAKAVEVTVSRQQTRYFTLIYSTDDVAISARAVAEVRGGGNACLLALDPTVPRAITVAGSSEVVFSGCDVATNSNAPDAFYMQGGAVEFTTGCVHSVGGVQPTSGLHMTACTSANTESPVVQDPYANLADPLIVGTCPLNTSLSGGKTGITVTPSQPHPLNMMSRCYRGGLDVKGKVTFQSGLYIIDGGSFKVNAGADVFGNGVTFFLTNGATIDFNGGAEINLSAPTSGPLSGILFYSDRDAVGVQHSISGNAGSTLDGAVYLPSSDLSYSGNYSGAGGCTQLVTRRVTFTGNSELNVNCSAAGTRPISVGEVIALVE